jgi:hypothetical protein
MVTERTNQPNERSKEFSNAVSALIRFLRDHPDNY